jgi:hypothetical protein
MTIKGGDKLKLFNLLKLNQRGNVDMAIGWVYGIIVIGFLCGAGLLALGAFKSAMTASSAEANATGDVITAIGNFATQLGTVGTMLGIALLIAVVFGALAYVAVKRE